MEPAGESAQVPTVIDSDFDELAGIERPESPETPASEPADTPETPKEGEPAEPAEPKQGEPQSPQQASAKAPTPTTFTVNGKKFSAEQIASDPKLLADLVASHGKLPNISRHEAELAEKVRELEGRFANAQVPPQEVPGQQTVPGSAGLSRWTPQQVTEALKPVVDLAVKQGWVDPDMAEYFPTFTAQAVLHRDLIYDVRAAVAEIQQWRRGLETRETTTNTRSEWNAALDALAGEGEMYSPLKEREGAVRSDFEKYMVENFGHFPKERVLTPEFLGRQWFAFNYEPVQEALRTAGAESRARVSRKRAVAGGEAVASGASGRPDNGSGEFDPDLLPADFKYPSHRR